MVTVLEFMCLSHEAVPNEKAEQWLAKAKYAMRNKEWPASWHNEKFISSFVDQKADYSLSALQKEHLRDAAMDEKSLASTGKGNLHLKEFSSKVDVIDWRRMYYSC